MSETPLDRIVGYFEALAPGDLERIADIYEADASFKDPFQEVLGLGPIREIYARMFERLDKPRFVVTHRMSAGADCFLAWEFHACARGKRPQAWCIRGATRLRLSSAGRIAEHRDYWDAAEEVYEKVPVLGSLMRWLKARAR
jgi:steroid delta-isomerase